MLKEHPSNSGLLKVKNKIIKERKWLIQREEELGKVSAYLYLKREILCRREHEGYGQIWQGDYYQSGLGSLQGWIIKIQGSRPLTWSVWNVGLPPPVLPQSGCRLAWDLSTFFPTYSFQNEKFYHRSDATFYLGNITFLISQIHK